MFGFIKKVFIGLLTITTSVIIISNHAKYVSFSNQKYTTQPTIIDLHPDECAQG